MDWLSKALDLLGLGVSAYGAAKKAKGTLSVKDRKDLWRYENPDVNDPYRTSKMVDNGSGGLRQETSFSPEIQKLFDSILGQLNQPIDRYDSGYGGLNNAQGNYQRSRYGLSPEEYQPPVDSSTGGGIETDDETPVYDPDTTDPITGTGGGGAGGGNHSSTQPGGYNPGGSRLPVGGGYGSSMMGQGIGGSRGYVPQGGNQGRGGYFGDTYNAGTIDKLFGQKDIGSIGQLKFSENGGNFGTLISALTGIPGGRQIGNWLGNRNINNKTWMSPVDPANPYQSQSDTSQQIRDLFNQPDLPNSPIPTSTPWRSAGTGKAGNLGAGSIYSRGQAGGLRGHDQNADIGQWNKDEEIFKRFGRMV